MCKTQATVQVLEKLKPAERTDLNDTRNEYLFRTPLLADVLEPMLKDERDKPMLYLLLNIAQISFTSAFFVYYVNIQGWSAWARHLCGLAHVVTLLVLFLERFMLMMHFSSHRTIFRNEALNSAIVWIYAPFFGVPNGVYKLHHVIMHHIENNHELDSTSTEPFQRDSWAHFLQYWARFVFGVWIELPLYCVQTKRWEWAQRLLAGLASYVITSVFLAKYVNFTATFYVFNLTYIIAMSALAFGNWSQHIFINPEDSTSNFGLTYNCLDNGANKRTFNDGYHAIHHINARLHWSEIPEYFLNNKDKHLQGGALTFRGLDFFEVGMFTMTKQLRKVAEHYVHLGSEDTAPTVEEVEAKLRKWLAPIHRDPVADKAK
mmetsp:Transcript_137643/g.326062  ORF Transcript_137643/g.326062 Transcript_137643/m.326062 type:complete len:375 (-) Transcript_137643:161-1285(-)|eukprot:CAMPEP_0181439100 /NCGR_PEP_ID=MMETSP1110-20121109/22254_1 /TAXON_ID=174948 /ORGANISM="Symbiodinium sp., Strain CCMP421" /LENGTH=374 /DNA_ID=CAMNT_0023562815 /DNA_START=77 /DNA_END=1201 /DNA_ORIENTATION=+